MIRLNTASAEVPAAVSESYLDQGELQVVQAGAPVSDLRRQLSATLAALRRNAGRHSSAPSLQHIGDVTFPTLFWSPRPRSTTASTAK